MFIRLIYTLTVFNAYYALADQRQPLIWCLDHVPQRQHYETGKAPYGPMVNLMQDLAARLNFKLVYTLPTPTNRCLQQLERGDVDVVASLLYSDDRAQRFYLLPYDVAHSESWFIHKDTRLNIQAGLKVTLVEDRIYSDSLMQKYKGAGYQINKVADIDGALTALFFRDTDVIVGPQHIILAQIARNARYKNILVLAPQNQQPASEAHIAISKTGRYANRHDAFRRAVRQIRQEGKYRLYN